jgi:hypothetical protein
LHGTGTMGTCSSDTGQLAGSWGSSAVPGRVGARTISCPLTPGGNPPSSVAAAKKHHKEGTAQPGLWVGVLEGQNHLDARAGVPPGRETGSHESGGQAESTLTAFLARGSFQPLGLWPRIALLPGQPSLLLLPHHPLQPSCGCHGGRGFLHPPLPTAGMG